MPIVGNLRIVDLSHALRKGIPQWPDSAPYHRENVQTGSEASGILRIDEHTGTHVDAPVGFSPSREAVDQISPDRLVVPITVIDVRELVRHQDDYLVTVEDVLAFENNHGDILPSSLVAACTGWATRWPHTADYLNIKQDGRMHIPGWDHDAVAFLVHSRFISGLGIDSISIDGGRIEEFANHRQTAAAGAYNVENMCNLERVPPNGAWVSVCPIAVSGGSGAPARVFAFF